uniref:MLLT10 histone lysine methyltransferase DOT1L cofactor n=1 Tax=Phocoena sinus TaxID=42100 RepID=A0A8C9C1T5_PHOSS
MVSSDRPVSLEDEVSHSMKEMIGGCCVCSDERGWAENPLVYCDGHGCSVAVHQACYGIVQVPTGPWFCRKCESQERAARVVGLMWFVPCIFQRYSLPMFQQWNQLFYSLCHMIVIIRLATFVMNKEEKAKQPLVLA